jgi:hypothetical protein
MNTACRGKGEVVDAITRISVFMYPAFAGMTL